MSNKVQYPKCIVEAIEYFEAPPNVVETVKTSPAVNFIRNSFSGFFKAKDDSTNDELHDLTVAIDFFSNYERKSFIPTTSHGINDSVVVNMIKPKLDGGPWIAGGAVRIWSLGQNVFEHDIDVWFRSEEQVADTIRHLKTVAGSSSAIAYKSSNAITMHIYDTTNKVRWRVQLIVSGFFEQPEDIIKNFDFTVSQMVTDGINVLYAQGSLPDVNNKKLVVVNYQEDLIKRMLKYMAYGYVPTQKTFSVIETNPTMFKWDFKGDIDEYTDVV